MGLCILAELQMASDGLFLFQLCDEPHKLLKAFHVGNVLQPPEPVTVLVLVIFLDLICLGNVEGRKCTDYRLCVGGG